MFRPRGRVGRVIDEPERSPGRDWMSASDLKFVIFRDLKDGYRWRLRAPTGETLDASLRGHRDKYSCYEEIRSVMTEYPYAHILDVAVG